MNQPQNPTLMKTCSVCGLQKPMSAFLQISGSQGTTYGSICAPCRKAAMDNQPVKKTEAEGGTSSETGHGISSKTRVHEDIDALHNKRQENSVDREDRKDLSALQEDNIEKKEILAQKEKRHRQSFLSNRSYLSTPKKADTSRTTEAGKAVEQQIKQTQSDDLIREKETATQEESKLTSVDSANPHLTYAGGRLALTTGLGVKALATKLGKSSPFTRALQQASLLTQEKNADPKKEDNAKEKSLEEFIEDTWKPTTRRT